MDSPCGRFRLSQYPRYKIRVQADLEEGCETEYDAQQADAGGKVQQPFPLGEGADAEHGDRDGE